MKVPVMVMRKKDDPNKYLAACIEVCDEQGEVTIDEIEHAYLIVRMDHQQPTQEDFENYKKMAAEYKQAMIERYGQNAFISLDFEAACEVYEPVNIEITQEQYEANKELLD